MANFGGSPASSHSMPDNPFSMPTTAAGFQHGSAEQYDASMMGSYLNSADGMSPRMSPRTSFNIPGRSTSPRMTRERSSRRDSTRSRDREDMPVGNGFRLNSLEQTVGVHAREIKQIKDMMETLVAQQTEKGQRLDQVFNQVDVKFTEAMGQIEKVVEVDMKPKLNMMTETINTFAQQTIGRMEHLDREMEQLKLLMAATRVQAQSNPANSPPETPPGMSRPTSPPSSWTAGPPGMQQHAPTNGHDNGAAATPGFGAGFGANFQRSSTQYASFQSYPGRSTNEGTFGQGATNYYVGSPSSPLQNATTAPSNFGQWAAGAGSEQRPFDVKDWSVEHKKPSKELRAFDGDMANYDNWRNRVMDHFISVNCNYSIIFDILEKCKTPIAWSTLRATHIAAVPHMNWEWLATHMWTFIGSYLNDTLLGDRLTLTHGESFNGLELWRMLHTQNSGGGVQMANTERGYFVGFPKCEKAADLSSHLGVWVRLKQKYGGALPTEHLIAMFWKILPDDIREDLKKQKDCANDLDKQIAYVYGELGTVLDDKLSAWNLSKLQKQVGRKPKNTTGINVVGASEEMVPPPPSVDIEYLNANIERMVNAAVARGRAPGRNGGARPDRPRSSSAGSQRGGNNRSMPNPRFKGCWCCGEEGHSRQKCPKFKAIKDANGGQVPKGYEGAYEKSMKKTTPLKALSAAPSSGPPPLDDHEETVRLWPMLGMPPPVKVSNKFSAFTDNDPDSDDEDDMVRSLSAMTSSVNLVSEKRMSQKSKKGRASKSQKLSHLNAVARKVKAGEIQMPEVDLDQDERYEYAWAMVDSGAGANVARRKHFRMSQRIAAPEISLTVANGETLPNQGARAVQCYDRNGSCRSRVFYEADVEMPILAVTELAREGELGTEVNLRHNGGEICDISTGRRSEVVKRMGVYFTRIYFPKSSHSEPLNEQLFVRPDM